MNLEHYDAWYDSPRGRWIGEVEFRLLIQEFASFAEAQILDVGCGTGWFTRRFACRPEFTVTGVDINPEALDFARRHDSRARYVQASALALPFEDNSFDAVFSVAALCFTGNWKKAVEEVVRVCRGNFAIGMLNRQSILWIVKGRNGGQGAYQGAFWVDAKSLLGGIDGLPVAKARLRSAVFLPSGSFFSRALEQLLSGQVLLGGMIFLTGKKSLYLPEGVSCFVPPRSQ